MTGHEIEATAASMLDGLTIGFIKVEAVQSPQFSMEDKRGLDVLLTLRKGGKRIDIPLQLKAALKKWENREQDWRSMNHVWILLQERDLQDSLSLAQETLKQVLQRCHEAPVGSPLKKIYQELEELV